MFATRLAVCLSVFLIAVPVLASAKPPLRDIKVIDDTLYYMAIANEIDEYCDSITGLRMKALSNL